MPAWKEPSSQGVARQKEPSPAVTVLGCRGNAPTVTPLTGAGAEALGVPVGQVHNDNFDQLLPNRFS